MEDFKTSDIVLAACLRLKDVDLIKIELVGNKGIFIFSNVDADFIDDYDLGRVQVEPVTFNNTIKQLTTSVKRITQRVK